MLRHELENALIPWRDNDVSTIAGPVIGVHYDPKSDTIMIKSEDDEKYLTTLQDIVKLLAELDHGVAKHDVGNSLWYLHWRKRIVIAVGCDERELSSRPSHEL